MENGHREGSISHQPDTTPTPHNQTGTVTDMTTPDTEAEYVGNPNLTDADIDAMNDDQFADHLNGMLDTWIADAAAKLREHIGPEASLQEQMNFLRDNGVALMPNDALLTLAAMAIWRLMTDQECEANGWSRSADITLSRDPEGSPVFAAYSPNLPNGDEDARVLRRARMSPFMMYRLEVDKTEQGPGFELRIRGMLEPFDDSGALIRDEIVPVESPL